MNLQIQYVQNLMCENKILKILLPKSECCRFFRILTIFQELSSAV